MANKNNEPAMEAETVTPVEPTPTVTPTAKTTESVYSVDDLISNFKAFRTSREIVIVALKKAGVKTATFAEAKTIIEKFKNKEVH